MKYAGPILGCRRRSRPIVISRGAIVGIRLSKCLDQADAES